VIICKAAPYSHNFRSAECCILT